MALSKLISEDIQKYILQNSNYMNAPDVQKKMYDSAMLDDHAMLNTPFHQLKFLEFLIKIMGAKKIIEIGVFRGVSTLSFALCLPEDGKVFACDITDKNLLSYKHYWEEAGVSNKIELIIKPAIEGLADIGFKHKGEIDFIYVDANKWQYNLYYELGYKLLRKGGIMVLDNMLREGKIIDHTIKRRSFEATRQMNDFIRQDARVESVLLPVGDGISMVRKI